MEQKRGGFSNNMLPLILGAIALGILVIIKIIFAFGVGSFVVAGIFSMIIYILPIIGAIVAYVENKNLYSFEFIFNLVVLGIALLAL